MKYNYQMNKRFFAQIASGMEDLATEELKNCGAEDIKPGYLGIYFNADQSTLYKINYTSRIIIRVLAPLFKFKCHSPEVLYKQAKKIDWEDFLSLDKTFAVFATVSNSKITHSKYAALKLKDAIVDHFRDKHGERPNVDTVNPDVWFSLRVENNKAVINLDTSGGSLHRRGYRKEMVSAPMQETLASAIIKFSSWKGDTPLYDPMCGSGTILMEALMQYCDIPAGFLRGSFGFEHLPEFDTELWIKLRKEADEKIRELPKNLISGSDISSKAISIAKNNSKNLKYGRNITLKKLDFHEINDLSNHTIICNPPYGIRLEKDSNLIQFYKDLGDFLKQKCKNSTAYIYFGNRVFLKSIGLKPSWKKVLKNGKLDGRLAKFELY